MYMYFNVKKIVKWFQTGKKEDYASLLFDNISTNMYGKKKKSIVIFDLIKVLKILIF